MSTAEQIINWGKAGIVVVIAGGVVYLGWLYYGCAKDAGTYNPIEVIPACLLGGIADKVKDGVKAYTEHTKQTAENIKCCAQDKSLSASEKAACIAKHGWMLALGPITAAIVKPKDYCQTKLNKDEVTKLTMGWTTGQTTKEKLDSLVQLQQKQLLDSIQKAKDEKDKKKKK